MCYCAKCFQASSDEKLVHFPRGMPPKEYGIPIGWYRFGLKLDLIFHLISLLINLIIKQ